MSPISILGSGAVGMALAAFLREAGRAVLLLQARQSHAPWTEMRIQVSGEDRLHDVIVPTLGWDLWPGGDGLLVIATKAHANEGIAERLREKAGDGPIVILQNGLDVEAPFLHRHFPGIYRGLLYVTSEILGEGELAFRAIQPSPIGVVRGEANQLAECVRSLHTESLPFREEPALEREVWKKTLVNAVFNTLCPLLECDNGIFYREEKLRGIVLALLAEGSRIAAACGVELDEESLGQQVMRISAGSSQLISTLQDLRKGQETEIDYLNLALVRRARALRPPREAPLLEALGRLIEVKSQVRRQAK